MLRSRVKQHTLWRVWLQERERERNNPMPPRVFADWVRTEPGACAHENTSKNPWCEDSYHHDCDGSVNNNRDGTNKRTHNHYCSTRPEQDEHTRDPILASRR